MDMSRFTSIRAEEDKAIRAILKDSWHKQTVVEILVSALS